MNKLLKILTLLLLSATFIYAQSITVNIGNLNPAYTDQIVSVPINVADFNNVGSFQLFVNIDSPDLELVSLPSASFNGRAIATNTLANAQASNEVRVVWISDGVNPLNFGSGTLFTLDFYISPTAAGNYSMGFNQVLISNVDGINLSTSVNSGLLTFQNALTPTVKVGNVSSTAATNSLVVPVTATAFNTVAGFDVRIEFDDQITVDPSTGIIDIPEIVTTTGTLISNSVVSGGKTTVVVSWVYDGTYDNTLTIPGNGNLFKFRVNYSGLAFGDYPLTITKAKVIRLSGAEVNANEIDGLLSIIDNPSALTVKIADVDPVYTDQMVVIPVDVSNFNGVGSFQFKVDFNTTNLRLVELPEGNYNGRNIITNTLENANANKELTVAWYSDGINALSLPDGELLKMKFYVEPTAAGSFTMAFNECFVWNLDGIIIHQGGISGLLTYAQPPVPTVIAGNGAVDVNYQVTIPITATAFKDAAAFDIRLDFDSSLVVDINTGILNLPDVVTSTGSLFKNQVTSNGVTTLIVTWVYDGTVLNTLTAGTDGDGKLFDIFFTYQLTDPDTLDLTFSKAKLVRVSGAEVNANTVAGQVFIPIITSTIPILDGWNLISAPSLYDDMGVTALFPTATSQAFAFSNGYLPVDTLENGKGYWLKFSGVQNVTLSGVRVTDEIPLAEGWNLVGIYDQSVDVAAIVTNPSNILQSSFFEFNAGYNPVTVLEPGKGYWIKASAAGTMNVTQTVKKDSPDQYQFEVTESMGTITLVDAANNKFTLYDANGESVVNGSVLPPVPPAGIFDVRFSTDRYAEDVASASPQINIKSATYPVKLSVQGGKYVITDIINGSLLNATLGDGESLTISNPSLNSLKIASVAIPVSFDLYQNYPNPFNPTTTIKFALAEFSEVNLSVYNLLGEKVVDLINKQMDAGYHEVEFNASNLPSGVYFYNISAGSFNSVKKMILIK